MQVFRKTDRQEVFAIKYTLIYYKRIRENKTRFVAEYKEGVLGWVVDIVRKTKLRREKGFLFKRYRVYMITEKPLRCNAQNTADVVRVIRRRAYNVYDGRSTHCTANDEPLPLRRKNIRVLTKRHKGHVILAKRRNKKMKKDWTKRHKEQTI